MPESLTTVVREQKGYLPLELIIRKLHAMYLDFYPDAKVNYLCIGVLTIRSAFLLVIHGLIHAANATTLQQQPDHMSYS